MAYFFKLPKITELTIAQQAALSESNAIAISGGPGTGKSIVSLWRHIRNYGTSSNQSLLLTYTKTLEAYLRASAKSENEHAGNAVSRTLWWITHHCNNQHYNEIIIDEAQDIGQDKYMLIKKYAKNVSYGADDNQILFPERATNQQQLAGIFSNNKKYILDENFRNSYEIMYFVKALFMRRVISQAMLDELLQEGKRSSKPVLLITNNNSEKQKKAIINIIKEFKSPTHNIAVLVPFQKDVNTYFDLVIDSGIHCSKFSTDDGSISEIENVHITTFKSSKGLEFDTVIIPDFDKMLYNVENMAVVNSNDYYVAITRAKRNLYLISTCIPSFLERTERQKLTYTKEII